MPPFENVLRRIRKQGSAAMTSTAADVQVAAEAAAAERVVGPVGPFSPGLPLRPSYGTTGDRPRAFDFTSGYNVVSRPDRDRRVSFTVLRELIDHYDVARMAIGHRIDDVRSLDWRIVPDDDVTADVSGAVELARRALKRPDGVRPFASWLAMYLEDVLRYDAGTLYKRRDRAGRAIGLEVVDGTTIAPLLDYYGRTPQDDAPAFVQFVQGVPWQWITARDLVYVPFRPQPNSPYGFAPLEAVLINANTDLRFQMHFLNYFTEGTIPGGFGQLPADLSSPEQIKAFQEYWDALMYDDQAAKRQIKWVPSGVEFDFPREESFDEKFPLFLMRKTAAAYHVTPNDLGFTEDVNRATGETQVEVQWRVGTRPLLMHVAGILTDYLQLDLGLPVKFEFDEGDEKDDRESEARAHDIYVKMGAESVDEVRVDVLGKEIDESRPVPRFIYSDRVGAIPLDSLFAIAGKIDPATAAPSEAVPLPTKPFAGADGILAGKLPGAPAFAHAPVDPDEPRRPELEHPVPGSQTAGTTDDPAVAAVAKALTAGITSATGIVGIDQVRDDVERVAKADGPIAAGLAVKADDTGRLLLLQRALEDGDPAGGCWEFPGGHLEGGEDTLAAAVREWSEETGCELPAGVDGGSWDGGNGTYRGHVWLIPTEDSLAINPTAGRVLNPDDPDGDAVEVCAWWDVDDLPGLPALRPELAADLDRVLPAIGGAYLAEGEAVRKELRRWRDNARTRVRKGLTPRTFRSEVLPAQLADVVAGRLAGATTREQVDGAFAAVVSPRQ